MIWLSDADYRLELLDSLGTVVKNVGVRSPIFPSPVWTRRQVDSAEAAYRLARDTRGADGRPRTRWIHRPELAQLQSDARGQLWVLLHLPSPDSVHVPPMPSSKRPSGDVTLAEIDSYHQTRIDLLDPTHGRLIAWTTLPGRWSFSGPSEIMRMTPTPDGRIVANVRQLRLAGSYTRLLGW
jgi:hypothetical protein